MMTTTPRIPIAIGTPAFPDLATPQADALEASRAALHGHAALFVTGAPGSGRSLVIAHLHRALGGRMLSAEDAFQAYGRRDPAAMEETLIDLLTVAHDAEDIVYFDDLILSVVPSSDADRPGYSDQLLRAYIEGLPARGKKLVVSADGRNTQRFGSTFAAVGIAAFDPAAIRTVIEHHAARTLDDVDFDDLHRAYPNLSGNALAFIGRIVAAERWPTVTTEAIVTLADEYLVQTNIDLAEVAPVSLDTLVGVELLVETLERTVLIPMTQPALARELGLRPKRGVLLHGEPGTGKTTIGRALAQRMKGKFFMIDGTFMPGEQFYQKFDRVMAEAVKNSPAVIFIDDADVLFRNGEMIGFARTLLSKLDGLESETQSRICIVMTAMDVADMPPAMVRSGRVEVWLEMKLPDAAARVAMIERFCAGLPTEIMRFDATRIAAATERFTPADLRGLAGDARGQLAYDRQRGLPVRSFEDYLVLAAVEIGGRKAILSTIRS